jgi:hypothetical protein
VAWPDCGFTGWEQPLRLTWESQTTAAKARGAGQAFIGSPEVSFDEAAQLWRMTYAVQTMAGVGAIARAHALDGRPGAAWADDGEPVAPPAPYTFLDTPAVLQGADGGRRLLAFANAQATQPGGVVLEGEGFSVDPSAPVFAPGPAGSWSALWVESPTVQRADGGYLLWYGGANEAWKVGVGLATSVDGAHWVPEVRNPVLEASADPENLEYFLSAGVSVLRSPDDTRWLMFYACVSKADFEAAPVANLCLASSVDGVAWVRSPSNPVIPRAFFLGLSEVVNGPLNPSVVVDWSDAAHPRFALFYEHSASWFGLVTAPLCAGMGG